jgi:general secretion pathway protein D
MRTPAHALAVGALLMLGACASEPVLKQARESIEQGRGAEALSTLARAMHEAPENVPYRTEYFRQRELLFAQWLGQAEALRLAGQREAAATLYRRVMEHDPANPRAKAGLAAIEAEERHQSVLGEAQKLFNEGKYLEAQERLAALLLENPRHREARRLQRGIEDSTLKPAIVPIRIRLSTAKPLSLELRDVPLRAVFEIISRAAAVSFVFDKDVRTDQRTSVSIRDAAIEDLIRIVLATNQLDQKVLTEKAVLVYPNTPQKQREYQELVLKSFYLANSDVKQTANMIRTLLRTRDIFMDEKLGLLIIKDTPNVIRLAERLIAAQDLAEPEVMLEVEVLEIGHSRLRDLGIRFPDSIAWSLVGGGTASPAPAGGVAITGGTPGVVSLPEWLNRGSELVRLSFTNPLFVLTLRQEDGTTTVLANPRIRVKNKERARVHIGDRVPVITTTAAAAGGFVSESVQYLDVGLKLDVEPVIHLEDDVGIKVGLEVSNIVREVRGGTTNTLTYQIGTRNASTILRLRDGETQVLAGLISDEDRRVANRVPGLGELPVVGRLFSATRDSIGKTEIILLITPRLLRTLARPDARTLEIAAGTEAATGAGSFSITPPAAQPSVVPPPAAPPRPAAPSAAPAPAPMVPFGGMQQNGAK